MTFAASEEAANNKAAQCLLKHAKYLIGSISGTTHVGFLPVLGSSNPGEDSRDIKASSRYLSGDPARIYFGLTDDSQLVEFVIRWSDGEMTRLSPVDSDTR